MAEKLGIEEIRKMVEERRQKTKKGDDGGRKEIGSKFIRDCLNSNELGDGELFKAVNEGKFIFNKAADRWMVWSGHHWDMDVMDQAAAAVEVVVEQYAEEVKRVSKELSETDDKYKNRYLTSLRNQLIKRISALRTDRRRNACLKWAHTSKNPMAIRGDELDRQPWLLACANCVVDLRTGASRPGRQDDYLYKACPTEWHGIDAPRDTWVKTLTDIFDGDELMVAFLQRLFGMAIVGAVIENVFVVLTGPGGRNGKTTIMETIKHVLGPLAGPIPSEMLLSSYRVTNSSGPTPDIMALRGLRIAWASETEDGAKVSAAKVKWLTGRDSLTGRNPHEKTPITFEPTHTLFLLTNFKPHADSQDKAFWERLINIPFTLRFLRNRRPIADNERVADPNLAEKLKAEASGILAWMVEGCLQWQKTGLDMPPRVVQENEDYLAEEDNIGAFIDFCCLTGPEEEFQVGASALYDVFSSWWKKYVGNFPPKQKKFGQYLRERYRYEKVGGLYRYFGISINQEVVAQIVN